MTWQLKWGIGLGLALVIGSQPAWAQSAKAPASASAAAVAAAADSQDRNLRAYVELLRSDLRAQKVAIVSEVMELSEAEDAKFWPAYREYETELQKVNDERMALIREYALNYDKLTDAVADRLARGVLDNEARRQTVKKAGYERLAKAVSAKTAARFLQVENQILLLLDLQIASSLPVVE